MLHFLLTGGHAYYFGIVAKLIKHHASDIKVRWGLNHDLVRYIAVGEGSLIKL